MYDTINLEIQADNSDREKVLSNLYDVSQRTYENGHSSFRGRLMPNAPSWVTVTSNKIKFTGSLSRLFKGSNNYTFNFRDTENAVMMLEDSLQLLLADARVYRIDVAANLYTSFNPSMFLNSLGVYRLDTGVRYRCETVEFSKSKNKQLCFYDKVKEIQSKGGKTIDLPHTLRYEMRLRRSQVSSYSIVDLFDKALQRELSLMWEVEYELVGKKSELMYPKGYITPSFAKEYLARCTAYELGEDGLLNLVGLWHQENKFMSSQEKYRTTKALKELCRPCDHYQVIEAHKEVDRLVREQVGMNL